jgi:YebC/PmpR family DNA-binding regulatory protein
MSGHSKWASIKHKKAAADSKRGKVFTKIIKAITVAARQSGGDPEKNPGLRLAISTAKGANMPADNIERAIKKGTGELEGVVYDEVYYEGYGPSGVALYIQCLTDNKNRTAAEIRSIMSKNGGNMGGAGSVAWMFEKKGLILIALADANEDTLMEIVLEAGADDFSKSGDTYEVVTTPQTFEEVKKAITNKKIPIKSADLTAIPKNQVNVDADGARAVLHLVELLEDHDDVQNVYANFEIPDEIMNTLN